MDRPRHLGRYRLVHLLATGGMGEVYLARHEGPAGFVRTVVVKRILRRFADDARFTEMFVNEARVAALLIHPNVVQVYELGIEDGEYFIAMEYVHGRSLRQALQRPDSAPIDPIRAAQVTWQLLQGLHSAHRTQDARGQSLGIVHRDVSPENVLINFDGVVKVTDFGIVGSIALSNAEQGALQGKLAYLSPEQSRGEPVDARADVYSCGVVLYEVLTGALPFAGRDRQALLATIQKQAPAPLRNLRPELPEALERVVLRALEKKPAARFATAGEMAEALEQYVRDAGQSLTPAPLAQWMEALFPGEASEPPGLSRAGAQPGTLPLNEHGDDLLPTALTHLGRPAPPTRARRVARGAAVLLGSLALLAGAAQGLRWRRERAVPTITAVQEVASPVATLPPEPPPEAAPSLEPTPPPRSAKPATSRTGRLSVRVNPWANVFVNGRALGISPVGPISLPAGKAVVVIKNPELGLERRVMVHIVGNEELLLKEDLLGHGADRRR